MRTLQPIRGRAPSSVEKSSILGADGRPMSVYLYPSPIRSARQNRPRHFLSPNTKQNVSPGDRWEMVNYSRQLFAQVDVLNAAVNQKNSWAFGEAWDAHFCGRNKDWGRVVQEWLNAQWMPNCNIRGPQYDLKTSLLLSGIGWDVDGDDVMVLTELQNGYPQLAFFPGTKIGTAYGGGMGRKTTVTEGTYSGANIFDGIIYDSNSYPLAVRIYGEEDTSFSDISTYNCDLAYEPQWADQGRGFPRTATSLLRFMNLQDIDEFLQKGVKRAASIGLVIKNEEGEAEVDNQIFDADEVRSDPNCTTDEKRVHYQEVNGGEDYYFSSDRFTGITPLDYKNPSTNVEAFIERITRGCLSSVGWYSELLDLSSTGRAPSRILCDLANRSIGARQTTGYKRWKRAISYAVSKGMKSGFIPKNNDGSDPYKWEPGFPKPISVDAGNEAAADREALKLGITNKSIVAQKMHGLHYQAIDDQREDELREGFMRARQMAADFTELSFDRCLELLEQRSPNPIAQQFMAPQTQDANA